MNNTTISKSKLKKQIITLLKKDFYRFAHLHSWYKHLPVKPIPFVFYLEKGEQYRYGFIPIDDKEGPHWHFVRKNKTNMDFILSKAAKGLTIYEANFGAFLRGLESERCGIDEFNFHGYQIILSDNPDAPEYLEKKYPNLYKKKLHWPSKEICKIFALEQKEFLDSILKFQKAKLEFDIE